MRGWLLDTNILSELRKTHCEPSVRRWVDARRPGELFLSTVTFAEIRFGIARLPDAARQHELNHWLDAELRPWFGGRILEITEDVILRWREMVERGRKSGHTFSQPDLFIAATADVHELSVATRNENDFASAGVAVVNPWHPA